MRKLASYFSGSVAPTVPDDDTCTLENSIFAGVRYDENRMPIHDPPELARLRLSYLPLEPIHDDFVANGKYLSYDNSDIHACTPPHQNGPNQIYWITPGRYRFGMTYQPQLTEEIDLVANQCYEIRFQGHVGSLSATVGPCTTSDPPSGS